MAKPITNRVKIGQTPVIKKDLEGGVLGEANNDGTIFVDKSVKEGTPLYNEVVGHEEKHMEQMRKGELSYDDNSVNYKGKEYVRKNGKIIDPKTGKGHPEGSMKFPWEKEADKAGKKARKKGNKNNNEDMNYNKNSGINMNIASPITKKAKGYSSPLNDNDPDKPTTVSTRVADADKNMVGLQTQKFIPGSGTGLSYNFELPKYTKFDPNIYKSFYEPLITSGEAKSKYGYTGKDPKELEKEVMKSRAKKAVKEVAGTKDKVETSFKPETKKIPGTDREQGPYEMGYYEARNKAASARVQEREGRRNIRQAQRAIKKYQRLPEGKKPIDPRTMKPFTSAEDYAKYKVKQVDFAAPVGTRKPGKLAEQPKTEYVKPGDPGTEGLPIVSKGKMISDFLQSRKKPTFGGLTVPDKISPFTMPGYGNKNN